MNRRLIVILALCSGLALSGLGVAEYHRQAERRISQDQLRAHHAVDHLRSMVQDIAIAARAYVSTGHDRFYQEYKNQQRQEEALSREIERLQRQPLQAVEHELVLSAEQKISSLLVRQRQAVNSAREQDFAQAIFLLHDDAYEQDWSDANGALERFEELYLGRLIQEQRAEQRIARLGLGAALGLGALNMALLLFTLLYFYRRQVIEPITALLEDIAAVVKDPQRPFRNTSLENEVGNVVRAVQQYHETALEVVHLRWASESKARVLADCQDSQSGEALAIHLASSLGRVLGCGAAGVYWRDLRYGGYRLAGAYGGALRSDIQDDNALIHQCAADGQPLELHQIPAGYITIFSGTGRCQPSHLYFFPIKRGKEGLGVIELATLHPLSTREKDWMIEVGGALSPLIERLLPTWLTQSLPSVAQTSSLSEQ